MGTITQGATDETRHEATEVRHRGQGADLRDHGPHHLLGQVGAGRGDTGDGAAWWLRVSC